MPVPTATATEAVITIFCRVVIVRALVIPIVVAWWRTAPVSVALAAMLAPKLNGADWTALADSSAARPVPPTTTPRLARNSRNRSTARLTRFIACAENCRHLAGRLAFEISQGQGIVVRSAQFAERSFQMRRDLFPDGVG